MTAQAPEGVSGTSLPAPVHPVRCRERSRAGHCPRLDRPGLPTQEANRPPDLGQMTQAPGASVSGTQLVTNLQMGLPPSNSACGALSLPPGTGSLGHVGLRRKEPCHPEGAWAGGCGRAHQQAGSGAWRVSSDRKRPRLQGTRGAGPLTLSAGQPASCPVSARTCQTRLPAGQRSPETAGQLSHCRSPSLQGQKRHVRLCPLPLHTRWPQGRTFE